MIGTSERWVHCCRHGIIIWRHPGLRGKRPIVNAHEPTERNLEAIVHACRYWKQEPHSLLVPEQCACFVEVAHANQG